MTAPDRMLVWLRETLDAAERDARDSVGEPWRAVDTPNGPEVHVGTGDDVDGKWARESLGVDAAYGCDDPYDDCDDARHGYLAEARLIAAHAGPDAVLRRINKERELLDDCENIIAGWHYDETKNLAEDTIRNRAEAWGWTEEEQR